MFTGSVLLTSGVSGSAYADSWLDGTPYMYEEARFLSQVLGHNVGAKLAPGISITKSAAYEVGDVRSFYVTDMRDSRQYSLKASARAISDKAYIFVESGRPAASATIQSLLDSFDGIYDSITNQFGPAPDSVDGDPRIYILIMDILDNPQNGTRFAGYFSPIDQYRNIQLSRWTNRRSNEVEILYIDYLTLNQKPDGAESVAAHEFTHMIQWARDPEESVWVNEGIAVYVESLLGYEVKDRISAFEEEPDTSLLNWSGSLADYGATYLFFAYISERFGGSPVIAAIVKREEEGTTGIERALAARGKFTSFESVFSDWVIANYLDDPELNGGIYGYATLDVHLHPSAVEASYPIANKTSRVMPWAARYIEFEKAEEDALSLTVRKNENDIAAQIISFGDEFEVSSIKSGAAQPGTALIPQENSRTILVVTSQPDPPTAKRTSSSYNYSAEIQANAISVSPTSSKKITTWGSVKQE